MVQGSGRWKTHPPTENIPHRTASYVRMITSHRFPAVACVRCERFHGRWRIRTEATQLKWPAAYLFGNGWGLLSEETSMIVRRIFGRAGTTMWDLIIRHLVGLGSMAFPDLRCGLGIHPIVQAFRCGG